MKKPVFPNIPPGLTPEAILARKQFMAKYQKMLDLAKGVSFTILVWGPDPTSSSSVAKKRVDIRDELIRLGHNAMFSEDMPELGLGLSEKSKEYAQAKAADVILNSS